MGKHKLRVFWYDTCQKTSQSFLTTLDLSQQEFILRIHYQGMYIPACFSEIGLFEQIVNKYTDQKWCLICSVSLCLQIPCQYVKPAGRVWVEIKGVMYPLHLSQNMNQISEEAIHPNGHGLCGAIGSSSGSHDFCHAHGLESCTEQIKNAKIIQEIIVGAPSHLFSMHTSHCGSGENEGHLV